MKRQWNLSKIAEHQSEAAGQKSYDSTVALFLKSRGLDIGSGVLIYNESKYYIVTAAHNVRGLAKGSIFIAHKDNELMRNPFQGEIYFHRNKNLDLACLIISRHEFDRTGKAFIDIRGMRFNYNGFPIKKYWGCVTGFPAHFTERKILNGGEILVGGGKTLWSDITRPTSRSTQFVYLSYPKEFRNNNGIKITNPPPPGLSGGGMWAVPINPRKDENLWSLKEMQLIGIQHTHNITRGILQGTKIQYVGDMLASI